MRPLRGRVRCGGAARGIQTCDPSGVGCAVWRRGGYKHATPPGSGVRCGGTGDTNMRPLRGQVCGVAARGGGYKHATPSGSGVRCGGAARGIQTCDPSGVGCGVAARGDTNMRPLRGRVCVPRSKNDPVGVIISINQSHCHLPDPEGVTCLIKKF